MMGGGGMGVAVTGGRGAVVAAASVVQGSCARFAGSHCVRQRRRVNLPPVSPSTRGSARTATGGTDKKADLIERSVKNRKARRQTTSGLFL